jgi:hypothetical protein
LSIRRNCFCNSFGYQLKDTEKPKNELFFILG